MLEEFHSMVGVDHHNGIACQSGVLQVAQHATYLVVELRDAGVVQIDNLVEVDQVIRALPLLLQRGLAAHYVAIGIGEDTDYLRALASELGVSERVHLLGHVTPEDLPRWYNAADVVTIANREIDGDTEGFGMVFPEAAACAKPTVAGLAGGTGAAVIDGATGLRVDGASIQDVADALGRVLMDPELAKRLGENGYRRALSGFSFLVAAGGGKDTASA